MTVRFDLNCVRNISQNNSFVPQLNVDLSDNEEANHSKTTSFHFLYSNNYWQIRWPYHRWPYNLLSQFVSAPSLYSLIIRWRRSQIFLKQRIECQLPNVFRNGTSEYSLIQPVHVYIKAVMRWNACHAVDMPRSYNSETAILLQFSVQQ